MENVTIRQSYLYENLYEKIRRIGYGYLYGGKYNDSTALLVREFARGNSYVRRRALVRWKLLRFASATCTGICTRKFVVVESGTCSGNRIIRL
jgi:hypothetical protein